MDSFFPIYIRVTHNRKQGYIKTTKVVEKKFVSKTKRGRAAAAVPQLHQKEWIINIFSDQHVIIKNIKTMACGIFLTVLTAIIVTFLGVGIADSEWLKKRVHHRFARYLIGLIVALVIFCPVYLGI